MAARYEVARKGFHFTLTLLGLEKSYIRSRFEDEVKFKNRYRRLVPAIWINAGYVVEVEDV